MTHAALPDVPWQLTGNHWVSLPCIHPADGSLHALGIIHRGARAAVEYAGNADFLKAGGEPLLKLSVEVDGQLRDFAQHTMAWERASEWIPSFTCVMDDVTVKGTIFTPCAGNSSLPGAVYGFLIQNRTEVEKKVVVRMAGTYGCRQLRVQTPRSVAGELRVSDAGDGTIILDESAPGLAAFVLATDDSSVAHVQDAAFSLSRSFTIGANTSRDGCFILGAGPERDGASAVTRMLLRSSWKDMLATTLEQLSAMQQSTGSDVIDRLINRNLYFAYFFSVARPVDDAGFYVVRSRVPWNSHGVTFRDWQALMWTIPAVLLADPPLARELIVRCCEMHGHAPNGAVHYLDGALFEPTVAIEGAAAYPIVVDRYIRDTNDQTIVDDPIVAETLYLVNDILGEHRDREVPLYATDVTPGGEVPAFVYTAHANAAIAQGLEVLRRTLDEKSAANVQDPAAVRAAIRRHFADRESKGAIASSVDLHGKRDERDLPSASMFWLPMFEAIARSDSLYRRTVKGIDVDSSQLEQVIARLIGPDSEQILTWLWRAPLHNGVAAELVDSQGAARANGGDAALSGLLAATVWYAVHALGTRVPH